MADIDPVITSLVAAWILGFAAGAAKLATGRRRRPLIWAVFGAILGPAAIALLELGPPGRCWSCDAPTRGWQSVCPWCGNDVRDPARDASAQGIRKPEPLSVDATATGAPIQGAFARRAIGAASNARGATVPNATPGPGRHAASAARSLRKGPPARSSEPARRRRGPPPVRGSGQ